MSKHLTLPSLCPHPPDIEPADVSVPMSPALKNCPMSSNEIPVDRCKFAVPGIGYYFCNICYHHWRCSYAWVELDLRTLAMTYRWKMKCKYCCFYDGHAGCKPVFTPEEIQKMTDKAISLHENAPLIKSGLKLYQMTSKVPHPKELCEMCGWGDMKCWTACHPDRDQPGSPLWV